MLLILMGSLELQEVIGLKQDEVDLLQDLEIYIDQAFFASFTFLQRDQVTRVHGVL